MGAAVLPSLLSLLLLVITAAGTGAEDAMIRPAAAAGPRPLPPSEANNKVLSETTLCCSNMTGYHECVEACFAILPPEDAVKYCDGGCKEAYQCQTVSGDECPSPSGHHSSPDFVIADSAVVGEVVVQEQVQAAGGTTTLCCSNMTGFHECVEACFAILPPDDAAKFCDGGCKEAYQCQTVSGHECPSSEHRSSSDDSSASLIFGAAKGDAAVDHCVLGCNSSVCNKMVTGVGRKGMVKHAVERCNNACYKICTKQRVGAGTSAA